ncbi:MAG: response regulator [Planctomycetota bacterium]
MLASPTDRGGIRRPRVLLVEDDPVVRQMEHELLLNAGYDVVVAEDGLQALELVVAEGLVVDLVVSDVEMPRMDGSELWRSFRAVLPDAPFLFTSGDPHWQRPDGFPPGRTDFLAKPFGFAELFRRIDGLLGLR